MGLKQIIDAYNVLDEGVTHMLYWKEESFTEVDLQDGARIDLKTKHDVLSETGNNLYNNYFMHTLIGMLGYTLRHPIKMITAQQYYRSEFIVDT